MMYTAKFSDLEVVTHALVGDRRASLLAWQARCTRRQIGAFLRLQRVGSVTFWQPYMRSPRLSDAVSDRLQIIGCSSRVLGFQDMDSSERTLAGFRPHFSQPPPPWTLSPRLIPGIYTYSA